MICIPVAIGTKLITQAGYEAKLIIPAYKVDLLYITIRNVKKMMIVFCVMQMGKYLDL